MDLFEHCYYRLGKKFMTFAGQWPYQKDRVKRGIFAVTIFIFITGLPPPILVLMRYHDDLNVLLDSVISGLFVTVGIIKWLGMIRNSQRVSYILANYNSMTIKTMKLLNRISTNWQVWARCQEVNILHEYAEQGKRKTIVYTVAVYSGILLFRIQPMIPKITEVVRKNSTEIEKFGYPVDYYYFDAQKYYWYINLHFCIWACTVMIPLVASDSMLIIYVQHVCGVLAALGHQLEQIGNNDIPNVEDLSSLVDKHNDAIEFADIIEATYKWDFFLIISLATMLINVLGVQILTKLNEPKSTIRFIGFAMALEVVLFVECSISQILMDHSINIRFNIYNSQWYRLLPRDQKVLQLMLMRCRIPCQLTAGKMLIMSLRNFGLTNRAAMSYFAVVRPN